MHIAIKRGQRAGPVGHAAPNKARFKSALIRKALGILVFSGAALQCQATTQILGTIDIYTEFTRTNTQQRMLVDHDGLNASKIAFRNTEDLGYMTVISDIEYPVIVAHGVTPPTDITGPRLAYMALQTEDGKLTVGKQYSPHYRVLSKLDGFGVSFWGNAYAIFKGGNKYQYGRNDMVLELAPITDLKLAFAGGYSPGNDNDGGRGYLTFTLWPLSHLYIGSAAVFDHRYSVADPDAKLFLLGAAYEFDWGRISAGRQRIRTTQLGQVIDESTCGGIVRLSEKLDVRLDYSSTRNANAPQNKALTYGLAVVYALNKRDAVYASVASLRNGSSSGVGFALPVDSGGTTHDVLAGLRMNF
ncbi:porin [Amantichitinum ursilacus]|uniref:Porin domain-containing protein n=1 Tax=Amantichitinum ursilacus TaxID=857265 RepID=A0A0N1JSN7_9NEIS|nr:porin [Amantichitinum ursilacus]KPC52718.1 hypothetical protein WG78_12760 [Amantichitinum ursilacus]